MKTLCPNCQTTFRITPEQLKARAGKVRCGQCQSVFNALDHLLEELAPTPAAVPLRVPASAPKAAQPSPLEKDALVPPPPAMPAVPPRAAESVDLVDDPAVRILLEPIRPAEPAPEEAAPVEAGAEHADETTHSFTAAETQEFGKAAGLILPRETTEIPGYSKWAHGVMAESPGLVQNRRARWPYAMAALVFFLVLIGQAAFRFRGELAILAPSLKPALESISQMLDADIPLPRHAELISIEASDLQTDDARDKLLVLSALLRNRAAYAQAFPALELTLTDTADSAIVRRVFRPEEYLPAKMKEANAFAANSDIAVRLWIEAKDIGAAGYRLYVFYP